MNDEEGRRPSVLITGATGYIGGRLATRLLASGWTTHAIVRPTSSTTDAVAACASRIVYDGTLNSLIGPVAEIRPDLIFHLASGFQQDFSPGGSEDLVLSNILFPVHLAEAMLAADCRNLVNTGTFWQHYLDRAYLPVDLYAATKQAAEDLLLYYHDVRGLSCATLTLFDTYGPADPRRKIVNLIVNAAKTKKPLALSPGEQILDITHVDDVVDAFVCAAEALLASPKPRWDKAYVSGERMPLKALVALVASFLNRPLEVELGARGYKPREIMTPVAPAASSLLSGWAPTRRLAGELPALLQAGEAAAHAN